jgi:transcriptional regulator with XRE-family HTH domain
MKKSLHDDAYFRFRNMLKEFREAKKLTQAQLAHRLSVPQSFVSKYETGERRLDIIETVLICQALETSADRLLSKLLKQPTRKVTQKRSQKRNRYGQ